MYGKKTITIATEQAMYYTKYGAKNETGASIKRIDTLIEKGIIKPLHHGKRLFFSEADIETIRQNLHERNALYSKESVAQRLGMTDVVFSWHIKKGNIPAPSITDAPYNNYKFYNAEEVVAVMKWFERYRNTKESLQLLQPGIIALGGHKEEAAWIRANHTRLKLVPKVTIGKNMRNKFYTKEQLLKALKECRILRQPRTTKGKK